MRVKSVISQHFILICYLHFLYSFTLFPLFTVIIIPHPFICTRQLHILIHLFILFPIPSFIHFVPIHHHSPLNKSTSHSHISSFIPLTSYSFIYSLRFPLIVIFIIISHLSSRPVPQGWAPVTSTCPSPVHLSVSYLKIFRVTQCCSLNTYSAPLNLPPFLVCLPFAALSHHPS